MGLKKLEIIGFKSFAKRTEIVFSQGINAIVGPNGCGKSNIVDAFLWALGEQSARALRGKQMHDVIFAGSQKMKSQNFAEVTITFDNSDKYLPIDYNEVAVTRRIFTEQGSQYQLNKQNVRLKDVQELFAHTGLAHESFAVIGQGRVEKTISQSPEERRAMFEEVAGILHFLIKRKESERKLELCQNNVSRAQDVVKEVSVQKEVLEKQAVDARKFQKDRQRLADLERHLCQMQLSHVEKAYTDRLQEIQVLNQQKTEQDKNEHQVKTALHEKKETLKTLRLEVSSLSDKQHALQNAQNLLSKEMSHSLEKYQNQKNSLEACQKERASLDERITVITKEKEAIELSHTKLKALQEKQEAEYSAVESKFHLATKANSQLEVSLKELYAARLRVQNEMQTIEVDQKKAILAEEVALDKLKQRKIQIDELETRLQKLKEEIEAKKDEKTKAVALVTNKKELVAALSQGISDFDQQIKTAMKALDEVKKELLEKQARCKLLERQLSDMDGFSNASKTLCKEASQEKSPLYGKLVPLLDFIEIDKDVPETFPLIGSLYESTLVVKTIKDLETCLASVSGKIEASFLVLEYLGIACDETGFTAKEKRALKKHLFDSVSFQETLEPGKRVSVPLLLSQNRYVDTLGVIFIGREKEHNLLARKRQAKQLQEEALSVQEALSVKENEIALIQEKKAEKVLVRAKEDEEMRKLDFEVVSCAFQIQELEKQHAAVLKECERQRQEIASFNQVLTSLESGRARFEEKVALCKKSLEEAESAIAAKDVTLQSQKKEYAELNDTRTSLLTKLHEAKAAVQKVLHDLELVKVQEAGAKKRLSYVLIEIETSSKIIQECQGKEKQAVVSLKTTKEDLEKISKELTDKDEALSVNEKEVVHLEELVLSLQQKKEELLASLSAKEVERSHLSTERNRYKDALDQMEAVSHEIDEDLTVEQLQEQCRRLRNAIDRNKNVNLMAIEELETVSERYSILQNQLEDLSKAKDELIKIITSLEKESKTAFKDTFEAVRASFKKHFETLFNGGEADLVLTDSQDLLKAGIEIIAKPPGKQMRSMQLLSGGEKSLTALALLFACFDVRPSPFCILDEVDAALDEANVERLGTLLQSFAGNLQFLVITHNKRTMARADVLIGVSMQEKGVSQIISLDFQKNEKSKAIAEIVEVG